MNEGWICPVCGKGNAPFSMKCGHCADTKNCKHQYIKQENIAPGGEVLNTYYFCMLCGHRRENDYLEL